MREFVRCGLVLVFSGVFLVGSLAVAAPRDADFEAGRRLLAELQYADAYDRLFAAFLRYPDDPEINFLLGRAAFEKGDYEAAIMAFDRVLIVHPEAMRVKLELARCYYGLRSYATARHYLLEVLDTNPPPAVKSNIQMMLDRIQERERRHFLHGSLVAGFSHDDNVRAAPNDDTIRIFLGNTAFDTTIPDKPGDNIYATTVTLTHVYRPERPGLLWKSSFFHYTGTYQFVDDLDTRYLGLTTGPSWQLSSGAVLDLHPLLSQLYLEHDRYLRSTGVEGRYTRMLGANVLLQLGAKVEDKRYFQDHNRDAFTTTFSFNELFQFGVTRLTFGVTAELENATADWLAYDRYGIDLRLERDFPRRLNLWISGHRHGAKYDADDPRFLTTRVDKVWSFAAGLRKTVWVERQRRLDIEIGYSHTNSNSNIALYTYDKDVINTSLAFSF